MYNYFLSIVIPVYNEEKRLDKSLPVIIDFCKKNFKKYEIIIVNDGSTDKTTSIVEKYKKNKNLRLLNNEKNRGKGYSVKKGILNSKGELILFTDSDLSTPISEFNKLIKFIKDYDIIIGSRALKESNVKTRFYKKFLGRIGNFFISLVVPNIKDTQCGFKLFKKDIAFKLFRKQTIDRWGFDFEILFLAKKYNYKIREVPVRWVEDKDSKVKLTDYPKTFIELFKIKLNNFKGVYDE